ncbi:restriction endonuclease subunit S, partial [Mycoplasma leonicaptivi]|uniref:restriction endonuclease subunit S n=1 Tax=Mycoplasma leonicaptivi TaxID=36742 RepID=UPI0006848049
MSKGLKPEIRFEGYFNDWKKDVLENLVEFKDNIRIPVKENVRFRGQYIYYGANGPQGKINGFTHTGENILLTEDGANDLDNYPVIFENKPIWVNNHAHVISSKYKWLDNYFLHLSLKNVNYKEYVLGSTRYKLTLGYLKTIPVNYLDNYEEEKKISILFKNIDNEISTQNLKIQKLENVKKELLQKMFADKDNLVPKIRFKEFENKWEETELENIVNYRSGSAHENFIDKYGQFKLINSKFISTEGREFKKTSIAFEKLSKNTITMVLSDVPNGKALAKTYLVENDNMYTLNQRIVGLTLKNDFNPIFLNDFLNRNLFLLHFDDGVNQTNLSINQIKITPVYFPSVPEQQKIAKLFS